MHYINLAGLSAESNINMRITDKRAGARCPTTCEQSKITKNIKKRRRKKVKYKICMVAHRTVKLPQRIGSMHSQDQLAHHLSFPTSPDLPPPPPIITESFLNCQIELSWGHLFNKCIIMKWKE